MSDERAKMMNRHEAAAYLGVSEATLRKWACERRGPMFCRLGRAVRYEKTELDRFIRENIVHHPAPAAVTTR